MYTPDFRTKITGENVTGKGETFGGLSLYEGLTFTSFSDRKGELEPSLQARLHETLRRVEEYAECPMNWLLLRGPYGVGKNPPGRRHRQTRSCAAGRWCCSSWSRPAGPPAGHLPAR